MNVIIGNARLYSACVIRVLALVTLFTALMSCTAVGQSEPQPYVIGPEDTVSVNVARHPEFSGEFYVPADGSVTLPAAGSIRMSGKTVSQVSEDISKALLKRLKKPDVTVSLKSPRRQQVYVAGAVANPGSYQMQPGWRCAEAVASAGGLAEGVRPEQCKAAIRKGVDGSSESINLAALLQPGTHEPGPTLQSGDTLVIEGPELMPVYVTGKVRNPGLYQLPKANASIVEALALAGGELETAALNRVSITHTSGTKETHDLTSAASAVKLQPMDMILVPEETARIAVLGHVNEPGFFLLRGTEPTTLVDAISQAKGTAQKANAGSVAIIRTENGKQQRQMYDIGRFLRSGDVTQNPTLRAGDVVYVAGSSKADWNDILSSAATMALILNPFL